MKEIKRKEKAISGFRLWRANYFCPSLEVTHSTRYIIHQAWSYMERAGPFLQLSVDLDVRYPYFSFERSLSRPLSYFSQKIKKFFLSEVFENGAWMFPRRFPVLSYEKHCFQRQFLFPRCILCSRYTAENFNENPSMRAVQRNFASTSKRALI